MVVHNVEYFYCKYYEANQE